TSTAALVALLFAVHPIHADAVANLAGRAEVLAGLQSLASLVAFLRSWEGERPIAWTAVSLVAFGAAVLSHESAIVTIGLAPLVAIRVVRPAPWALARRLVPFLIVAAAFVAVRAWVTGSLTLRDVPPFLGNPLAHGGLGSRLATAFVVIGQYLSV